MNHLRVLSIHFYCVLLSVFTIRFGIDQGQLQLTCTAPTMFIAVPEAVYNNGAAILDAFLNVDNTIEVMSNVISTPSESGPEYSGFSKCCRAFRMGKEETR